MRQGWYARVVAVVVAGALALGACGSSDGGDTLPDLELPALRGGDSLRLADVQGPAVVNLWATWCAPCRRELPDFEAVHQAQGDAVRFVGINIADDPGDAADYLDELGVTFDQYLDEDGAVTSALGTATLPVTIVIDADGHIVRQHIGALDQGELEQSIEQVTAAA